VTPVTDPTRGDRTRYEIVAYEPSLKSRLFPLQEYLWSPELTEDVWGKYLDWKYARNPYMDAPLIHLAMHAGEVVGMRGMCGRRWSVGRPARQVDIPCSGDLVVAPSHRNRGIFRMLVKAGLEEAARRGYVHTMTFSASTVAAAGLAAMGWRALDSFEPMRRRSRSLRVAHALRDRGMRALALLRRARRSVGPRPAWRRRRPRRSFDRLDAEGEALSRLARSRLRFSRRPEPEAMAGLVARMGSDGRIRHIRDAAYFRWRFGNPTCRYRFLFWSGAERLDGYLVLQTSILSSKFGVHVVEWEASLPAVREALLRAAVERGRFHDLRIWSSCLPEDSRALLRDLGFRRAGEAHGAAERRLMIRPVRDEMLEKDWTLAGRRLLDVAEWDLRMSDSDLY
jgi:GNAT superfamily N-acetyltransferase